MPTICRSTFLVLLYSFLIALLPDCLFGQTPFYYQFDEERDNFPSTEVYDLEEDDQGRIWVATDRGAMIYNSDEFTEPFLLDSLIRQNFYRIEKLADQKLLFINYNTGYTILEGQNQLSTPRWVEEAENTKNIEVKGNRSFIDSSGNVLINSFYHSRIAYFWDAESQNFTQVDTSSLPVKELRDLPRKLKSYDLFGKMQWLVFRNDPAQRLPQSTQTYLGSKRFAFSHWDTGSDSTQLAWVDDTAYHHLLTVAHKISRAYLDRFNCLWFFGTDGLYCFDEYLHSNRHQHYFPGTNVMDMVQDREHNYWISTKDQGVRRIPQLHLISERHPATKDFLNVQSLTVLDSILVMQNLRSGFLLIYPSGRFHKTPSQEVDFATWTHSLATHKMDAMSQYASNTLLMVFNSTMDNFNDLRKALHPNYHVTLGHAILEDSIEIYFPDRNFLIRKKTDQTYHPPKFTNGTALQDRILNIEKLANGRIYLGGFRGYYQLTVGATPEVVNYADSFPALHTRISACQTIDSTRTSVWLASLGEGLFFFNGDTLQHFSVQHGLSNNLVQCLLLENDSTLWAGTVKGLNRIRFTYDSNTNEVSVHTIQSFGRDDGLPANRINSLAFWQGQLWVATKAGAYPIRKELLQTHTASPKVKIIRLRTSDAWTLPTPNLVLSPDQRGIEFQYQGYSHHRSLVDNFYRYRLHKKDEKVLEWSYTNQKKVQFTNLTQGDYCFTLQAQNNHRQWSEVPVNYAFTVEPKFTETLTFLLLMVLSGGILVGSIMYVRVYITRKAFQFKLRLRDSELRLLRSQMSPHFVFNLLNSLQQFIFNNRPEEANLYLAKLSRLMRNSIDFSKASFISLAEELQFLDNYLQLEKSRFEDQLSFTVAIDAPLEKVSSGLLVPPMLVQPLLENAIKHGITGLDYGGHLSVHLFQQDHHICFEVRDNGSGIDMSEQLLPKKDQRQHALSILRDRIQLLNSEGYTPKASLFITNLEDTAENRSGTLVRLLLPRLTNSSINTHLKSTPKRHANHIDHRR